MATELLQPRDDTTRDTILTCARKLTPACDGQKDLPCFGGTSPVELCPVQLRNPDITYGLFRRQLKGHLFREA